MDHNHPHAATPKPATRITLLVLSLIVPLLASLAFAAPSRAAAPADFFGLTVVRPAEGDLQRTADAGSGLHRIEISWRVVQKELDGDYNWAPIDKRFIDAADAGMQPLPILFGTPEFVTKREGILVPPTRSKKFRQEWQRFAATAIARYGPGGALWTNSLFGGPDGSFAPDEWIVWNEQNARAFWHPKASPSEYAKLLKITRRAVRSQNEDIKLIVGGMYGFPQHEKAMDAEPFLKRLYKQKNMAKAIDGVSVHPYAPGFKGVKKQVRTARKIMNKSGDGKASIYVGEIGWASAGPEKSFLVKSKQRQAKLLNRSIGLLLKKRLKWNIHGVFWFTFQDYAGDPVCNWCPKAGLFNRKGKPKPAFEAWKKLVDRSTG